MRELLAHALVFPSFDGIIRDGQEVGMNQTLLPSDRAKAKLAKAQRLKEAAVHKADLAAARIAKWSKRIKVLEKKLGSDYYKERDEKARDAAVERMAAEKMKVALGIKPGPRVDSSGKPTRPVLRSEHCIRNYHGMCGGKGPWIGKCHCMCHS